MTAWHRRNFWWAAMRDAHRRLRDSGIEPNAPDLPPQCAGENERNVAACERGLVEAGFDAATVDAKMRHVVLVFEKEARRFEHLGQFKPAIIWDPKRFNRAVDTSLDEAAEPRGYPRAGPRPAGSAIGAATPRADHPTSAEPEPFGKGLR